MSECGVFDEEKFMKTLKDLDQANPEDHIIESLGQCPTTFLGGKRRKRKLKGGQIVTKHNIKIVIYVILAGLIALATQSPNMIVITTGITMMMRGQCGNVISRLFGPFQNPVCVYYNNLTNAVLAAIQGDPTAISLLVGAAGIAITGPVAVMTTIDNIADRIEGNVNTRFAALTNGSSVPEITNSGGKSSKRKHSRKHKKTNRRRRY